jgi:transcription elongation factor Elf1
MPEPENIDDIKPIVATLHYFQVTDAYHCTACKKTSVDVIRVAQTVNNKTIITPMCEECASVEMDGLLKSGDMVADLEDNRLVAPFIADIAKQFVKKGS